jgi:phosphoribosylformylglycinamidine synthase subunit PurS
MPRVVVSVMPKPEILDPQGKAVQQALPRLGFHGVTDVRQGKRFELEVDGELTEARLGEIHDLAERLLSNPVIEDFTVVVHEDVMAADQAVHHGPEGVQA